MESRSAASSMFSAACVAAASAAHALPPSDHASLVLFDGGNSGMPGSTEVPGEAETSFSQRVDWKIQAP